MTKHPIDKPPKYRYAIYSRDNRENQYQWYLESSAADKWQAEKFFKQYQTWGIPNLDFKLVDWQEQKELDNYTGAKQ